MSRLFRSVLTLVLAMPLMAQDAPQGVQDAKQGGGAGAGGSKGGIRAVDTEAVEKSEKEGYDPETGAKTGFTLDKQPTIQTARGHCRFDGTIQPRRLMPGQTGKLILTMMLEGDSVMPAPSTLSLKGAQGGMAIGSWSMLPAQPGRIAPAYMGQPVYDNWAVIEATVTMPSEARLGEKRSAVLDLEFDLSSGSTGQSFGHFRESVSVPCEVGVALNPNVVSLPSAPVAPSSAPAEAAPAKLVEPALVEGGDANVQSDRSTPQAAEMTEPTPVAAPHSGQDDMGSSAELAPAVEESTKDSLLLVGGGAAVVIVLVAVLMMRRR